MAVTVALEHVTAILADALLTDPRHLAGASEEATAMWRWHAIEEIEHKAVAFDTFLAAQSGRPAAPRADLPDPMRFYEIAPEAWTDVIDTNVNGPFHMARAVAPKLVERGWGRIVNVVTSHYTMHMRATSPYGPSKAALESLVRTLAQELGPRNIRVNTVSAGVVDTDAATQPHR